MIQKTCTLYIITGRSGKQISFCRLSQPDENRNQISPPVAAVHSPNHFFIANIYSIRYCKEKAYG